MSVSPQGHKFPLSVQDLSLSLRTLPFSLTLARGEALSLLAEDGTTLRRFCDILAGYVAPACGEILIDGVDVTSTDASRRAVSLISPRDPAFGHLTVRENIAFPLCVRGLTQGEREAGVARFLALLGLDGLASVRADRLTAEHNLRLRLARSLAYAPSVLVLDDIMNGLDLREESRIRQVLSRLHRALGLSLIYAARSREDSVWLGGRIALFDNHTLVQCAEASTLLERPTAPESARLFGEANLLSGRVLEIEDDVARIHLACGGVVEAMAEPDLAEDTLCTLCIRPDRMTPLFSTPIAGEDDMPPLMATIQSVLHTGDQMRLKLRLSDGGEIEMRRPLLQSMRMMTPGTALQLAWQASQAVAFPMKDAL